MAKTNIKTLPHNDEAEKAVLGGMLRDKMLLSDGLAYVTVNDFYEENEANRIIFEAMHTINNAKLVVDANSLIAELGNKQLLQKVGDVNYIAECVATHISPVSFKQSLKVVQELSNFRQFMKEIYRIEDDFEQGKIDDPVRFVGVSEESLRKIADKRQIEEFKSAESVSRRVFEELSKLKYTGSDDTVTGVPTGFKNINKLTHGFQKTQLIILAARPGVGKTALSLNLMYNAARHDVPCAYFSLEMPADQLFKRLISLDAQVEHEMLLTGKGFDQEAKLAVRESCSRLSKMKMYIDDTSGIQILDICAKIRKLKEKEPNLGLVVVDYIGLVRTNLKTKSDNRQLEIQYISQSLKNLALELGIAIIGVAQLNRGAELNKNGRPGLENLRESGSLEQDADIVILLSRASQKLATEKVDAQADTPANKIGERNAQVIDDVAASEGKPGSVTVCVDIAKNRAGQADICYLMFRKNYCCFDAFTQQNEKLVRSIDEEAIATNVAMTRRK